jgi:sensor histidine kinase YesM
MNFEAESISFKSAPKYLFYTFVFDTVIAVFLTAIKFGGFIDNFIFSQAIGLSICTCVLLVLYFFKTARPIYQAVMVAAALIIGSLCGSFLGTLASGMRLATLFEKHGLIELLILGVMFGSIITYIFTSRNRIAASEVRVQEEKIKHLISEKKVAEANLRILQAQIEPHFLFNTLSNVLNLLDTDPAKGKSMLEDFTRYLRTSLSKIRGQTTRLGHEMEMIQAYLNIFKVRMGNRLQFNLDLPSDLRETPFPPMLIQPLVENAIKHGLEPKVEGGKIFIRADLNGNLLRMEISDTGVGFKGDRNDGLGLVNIRERLQSLYGDDGRLVIEENQSGGVKATIEVPHGKS